MNLVKSKQRVKDHGEVFTPGWLVEEMLNLVSRETSRIDSRFLEPACGSGNFLTSVLLKKLQTVEERYGANAFERQHYALVALMSVYGIELLQDNALECRVNLWEVFCTQLRVNLGSALAGAAAAVLETNIVVGDALKLENSKGAPIIFAEWSYIGKGKFQRRDFQFSELVQVSSFGQGTLFENLRPDEIFRPLMSHPPVNLDGIATLMAIN